jgi:hypothetical protein
MSVAITYGRRRVRWMPLRVAELLADELSALGRAIGQSSGFEINESDEVHVDDGALAAFVTATLDMLEHTGSSELTALAAGPLQVAIALHGTISGDWPDTSERLVPIVSGARTLFANGSDGG